MNTNEENMGAPVRVRFTPAQVDAIKSAASAADITVSEHIRRIVLSDHLTSNAMLQERVQKKDDSDADT